MPDFQIALTSEEKDLLLRLLESTLRGELVEMRHTDARAYRELIKHEIAVVETLLSKLKSQG
jgi:hypothetical protein